MPTWLIDQILSPPCGDDIDRRIGRSIPVAAPTSGRNRPVASVTKFIKDLARSPRGQQLVEQVKEQARKPENRRKLEELRKRYGKRR
jgi:hypothetical protein